MIASNCEPVRKFMKLCSGKYDLNLKNFISRLYLPTSYGQCTQPGLQFI